MLAALPATAYARLLPHLEKVPLALGRAIYESGGQQQYVYFPTISIVSLRYVMQNDSSAGLIRYSRGKITVLDRPKLEARSCECYAVVKQESDRLLSGMAAIAEQPS